MSPESPYVHLYIARSQAELIEQLLAREAEGRALSSPYRRALKVVREALGRIGGVGA